VRGLEESRVGTAYIIVRAAGPSCADLVKAMSGALGELSRRLAADLANLPLPLPPYMESNR